MRRPLLTNKALRGLRALSRIAVEMGPFTTEEWSDAVRAREWIAAMGEYWRSTHGGRRP
jgi:hypothetical protein